MDRCHFCLVTQYLNFLLIPEECLIRHALGGRQDFRLTTSRLPGHEHRFGLNKTLVLKWVTQR